jgi:hypothetical protein
LHENFSKITDFVAKKPLVDAREEMDGWMDWEEVHSIIIKKGAELWKLVTQSSFLVGSSWTPLLPMVED